MEDGLVTAAILLPCALGCSPHFGGKSRTEIPIRVACIQGFANQISQVFDFLAQFI